MNIIEERYNWDGRLTTRDATDYIVLHHAAASSAGPQDIHRMHKNNGWAGIGYHFYVRKDGVVYRGRPAFAIGAHCQGYNNISIGICAEGDYQNENEIMPATQKKAIVDMLQYAIRLYPKVKVVGHRNLNATACPGANYPFDEIVRAKQNRGDELEVRYQVLRDIPNDCGFRDIVDILMNADIIKGDGSDPAGNDDVIDLSHDQVRMLAFLYRGGAFDRKLIAMGIESAVK